MILKLERPHEFYVFMNGICETLPPFAATLQSLVKRTLTRHSSILQSFPASLAWETMKMKKCHQQTAGSKESKEIFICLKMTSFLQSQSDLCIDVHAFPVENKGVSGIRQCHCDSVASN